MLTAAMPYDFEHRRETESSTKTLGLMVPAGVLALADEVIE